MDSFPNIDRNLPPPSEPLVRQNGTDRPVIYFKDIAGNNVPIDIDYIATIKSKLNMSEKEMETLIKRGRSPSPCPCRSEECREGWQKEKEAYQTLLTARAKGENLPTLTHPSGWGHGTQAIRRDN